jgi:Na+-driven multidrug efflux pump
MAMAAAPLVGQALGAAKPERARHAVRLSVVLVAAGTLVPYAIMMWQGRLITRFFVDDPAVTREAVRFFLIVPASNYFFTVMMVLSAAFYGSGHTRPVMVVSLLRQWALRMPMAYFFGYILGWGSLGIYTGMGLANILCAVLMLWIFLRGNWTRAVIPASIEEEAEIQAEAEIEALDVAGSD